MTRRATGSALVESGFDVKLWRGYDVHLATRTGPKNNNASLWFCMYDEVIPPQIRPNGISIARVRRRAVL